MIPFEWIEIKHLLLKGEMLRPFDIPPVLFDKFLYGNAVFDPVDKYEILYG